MSVKPVSYDVVVAGGGPSGIVAAIASARAGAKTLLVERNGYLGGHLPGCVILHGFFDQDGGQVVRGIPFEIVERARALNGALRRIRLNHPGTSAALAVEHETFKFVVTEMLVEAGCEILLDTVVIDQESRGADGVTLSIHNKSGIQKVEAKAVVDATGDADIATRAGAKFKMGREHDGKTQPITLFFSVIGVDVEKIVSVMNLPSGRSEDPLPGQAGGELNWFDATLEPWAAEAERENLFPHVADKRSIRFSAYSIRKGELYVNATFVNGLDPTSGRDLTLARNECQRQMFRLIPFFRAHVPGFEGAELTWSSPTLFVRESRRIEGDYMLTYDDFRQARRFDDVVARSGYIAAIHNPDPKGGLALEGNANQSLTRKAFDIPYRALLPVGVEAIIVCGRSISASTEALSSARTAGAVMATGQAAGAAAALSAQKGTSLRQLDVALLQAELTRQHADLGR